MGFAKFDAQKVINSINTNDSRKMYYEGVGINVNNAHSVEAALKLSGLAWNVVKRPMAYVTPITKTAYDGVTGELVEYVENKYDVFPNQYVTVREDTNTPLGVVGKNYNILSNMDSFEFLNVLVENGDAQFETAGYYGNNDSRTFITIKTNNVDILGDQYHSTILLLNSFDGSGSVIAVETPIRVFCSNCITRALKEATGKISIKHCAQLMGRIEEAKQMLMSHEAYLKALRTEAERLALIPYTEEQFKSLVEEVYPINEGDKDIIRFRAEQQRDHLLAAYRQDDLANFNGTGWKAVQAFSDAESHKLLMRNTKTANLANIKTVINGMPLVNMVADRILALA